MMDESLPGGANLQFIGQCCNM